jgi:hypothetical protein
MAFLQSRLAALGSLHRDIAALTETSNVADLLNMVERVNERLRELHPIAINEHEKMAIEAQVREIAFIGRRVLDQ